MRADERALRQIMVNLLSNAVKFTPHGGGVTVRFCDVRADGGVAIGVSDTGVGIKPEEMQQRPRTLRPGRHDVATTNEGGTGLGLPIVKGLVELHGGTLAHRKHARQRHDRAPSNSRRAASCSPRPSLTPRERRLTPRRALCLLA